MEYLRDVKRYLRIFPVWNLPYQALEYIPKTVYIP